MTDGAGSGYRRSMFHVHRSNRLDRLADALADELRRSPPGAPAIREWIAVQSLGGRDFLERALSLRLGICANVAMPFPSELFARIAAWTLGEDLWGAAIVGEGAMALAIVEELPGLLSAPPFEPVRAYLEREGSGAALHGLSRKIAHAFSEYALYRPEMVALWASREGSDGWQPILFRAVTARLGDGRGPAASQAEIARRVVEALRRGDGGALPSRISIFGVTALPPAYLEVLSAASRAAEVHLYVSSPSREFLGEAGRGFGNPLIASCGRIARDFQGALEERTRYVEAEDLYEEPAPPEGSVLGTLQADMLHFVRRGDGPGAAAPRLTRAPDDASLRVVACRGALRQVEAVREALLSLFADPAAALRPEEVAVLAPDIRPFAPLIGAVFGGVPTSRGPSSIAIPHVVHGGAPPDPVVEAAIALLSLAQSRVTAPELLALIARPSVRRSLGLDRAQLDALKGALLSAGARFGLDAAHRSRLGLPALSEGTWRFALDRMLVGLAISGAERASWRGLAPFDAGAVGDDAAVAKLLPGVEAMLEAVASLAAPRPIAAWCADLRRAMAAVTGGGDADPDTDALEDALSSLARDAGAARSASAVGPAVVSAEIAARVAAGEGGRTAAGGVVCADLARMRGVPFRVICVVGLDDATFPRRGTPPGFDLMAIDPRPGDRSPRDEDKAVFLEAIAAARERLFLTFSSGAGAQKSATPSSVVATLLAAVEEGFAGAPAVARQPLEPFSPRCFAAAPDEGGEGLRFDEIAFAAASAVPSRDPEGAGRLRVGAPFAPEPDAGGALELADLVRFFREPSRTFCERSLGVRIPRGEGEIPEREPLELGHLEAYSVGNRALRALAEGADVASAYAEIAGEGRLPVGPCGRLVHEEIAAKAGEISRELRAFQGGGAPRPGDVVAIAIGLETAGGPCALAGTVDGAFPGGRLSADFGRRDGKRLVEAWLGHLALSCTDEGRGARTFMFHSEKSGEVRAELRAVDDARGLLARLVEIYRRGQREPLPLFPKSSFAYAEACGWQPKRGRRRTAEETEDRAVKETLKVWQTGAYAGAPPGECEEPATRLLWGEALPWEAFRTLAIEVYGPLLAHLEVPEGEP